MTKSIFAKLGNWLAVFRDEEFVICRNDLDEASLTNAYGADIKIRDLGKECPFSGMRKPVWTGEKFEEGETCAEREARVDRETERIISAWCFERGACEAKFLRLGAIDNEDKEFVAYNDFVRKTVDEQKAKKL